MVYQGEVGAVYVHIAVVDIKNYISRVCSLTYYVSELADPPIATFMSGTAASPLLSRLANSSASLKSTTSYATTTTCQLPHTKSILLHKSRLLWLSLRKRLLL